MILAIVQARMGSTRLPGKVLKEVCGKSLIEILLKRLSRSKKIDKIILATSEKPENDLLVKTVEKLGFEVFRGNDNDVLDRYYQAAKQQHPDIVVRITGDCPLIDYQVTDQVINYFLENDLDYVCNGDPPTFPDGLDTEVFTFESLEKACKEASQQYEREHVTPFIRESELFRVGNFYGDEDFSGERWTVDYPEDFQLIKAIIENFNDSGEYFGLKDILRYKKSHPHVFEINKHIIRNDGAMKSNGVKLWNRAKQIIPGGNMLLSKRAEMFLPEKWPTYYSKARGCTIWDLDGNEYIDISTMGIGTNILGYGHPEVDEAVRQVVNKGNMSTFNCPEEVYLAEKLVELHPWADMVRFARAGGEACSVAIRIARAASGKDKVAFCGYHGWHDWYLSANLGDETNLDGHLLPGLEPRGVPRNLKHTALTFNYNDLNSLQQLVNEHDIGVIIMEVSRSLEPENGFLESVRKLAIEKNIVLIFDECTSGFRETFGGLHKKYGVNPDMAVFGKALGNGYAITAVIGRREVMEAAQSTFISSTFWTERIGPTAGLKTLEVMEREESWQQITEIGKNIKKNWTQLSKKYNLPLEVSGLPALVCFSIPVENWLKYKTLITQEMLKDGFLATNIVFVCCEHKPELIDSYIDKLDPIFSLIEECENGKNIDEFLDGPVCHSGFKRLN
jgi:glutamate-1-semialdehyde aminotransferase/spore coat polysaccharide biosynthesis protein SpsF (cytidylyltransferase family)